LRQKSLIVKQAVPYLRIAGEGFPLSRERMNYEIRALQFYEELLPKHVPKIHYADEAMSLLIMENLSEHIIMRKGLIDTTYYPNFSEHISTFLAQTLFYSSSLYLDSTEKRALVDRFNHNTELCKLTEDFVFTLPYMEDETNEINPELLEEAEALFKESEMSAALDLEGVIENSDGIEAEVYLSSLMTINLDSKEEALYLDKLAKGLKLSEDAVDAFHTKLGVVKLYS